MASQLDSAFPNNPKEKPLGNSYTNDLKLNRQLQPNSFYSADSLNGTANGVGTGKTALVNLQDLPDDLLQRIIAASLADVNRGLPYYPAKLAPHLLQLSQTSRALQAAVAVHLPCDLPWLDSDLLPEPLTSDACANILAWYRAARPGLKELILHNQLRHAANLRLRVMSSLLAAQPPSPLRYIDLVGVLDGLRLPREPSTDRDAASAQEVENDRDDADHEDGYTDDDSDDDTDDDTDDDSEEEDEEDQKLDAIPFMQSVTALLTRVRHTLQSIRLEPLSFVVDAVATAGLHSVNTLHILLSTRTDPSSNLLRLAQALPGVTKLILSCRMPFPSSLHPATFAAALPKVTDLDFRDSGAAMAAITSSTPETPSHAIDVAAAFRNLQTLSFEGVRFDTLDGQANRFWPAHRFPHTQLSFVQCKFPLLPQVLPAHVGPAVRRLELSAQLGSRDIAALSEKCPNLHTAVITLRRAAASAFPEALAAWSALSSLTLSFPASVEDDVPHEQVRSSIVMALTTKAGPNFSKFVLLSETLSVAAISTIMRALGPRIEYFVTGIYSPRDSRSKCIMRLLKVIRAHCPEMRVLCFGLALSYDRHAICLNAEFHKQISVTSRKLKYLNTWWLEQNALNLKKMERPDDFVDYESENDDSWDDDKSE